VHLELVHAGADPECGIPVAARVVAAHVVADDVAPVRARVLELDGEVTGARVVVGDVVLDDRVGRPAVEIEAAAVRRSDDAVAIRLVVLDDDLAGVPGPDPDRAPLVTRGLAPILVGDGVLDHPVAHVGDLDAAPRVLGDAAHARVAVGARASDVQPVVGIAPRRRIERPVHRDPAAPVLVDGHAGDAHVAEAALPARAVDVDPVLGEARDVHVVDAQVLELDVPGPVVDGPDA
jgi:hypothetical protein